MTNIPKHIAIIMDGNGRWAADRDLPRAVGHKRGAEVIEDIVEAASDRGVRYITLYAFSEENWSRPSEEVKALMQLLKLFLAGKRDGMIKKNVRFRAIGDLEKLSPDVREEISITENATKDCKKIDLIVALSYGSRQEILKAVNALAAKGKKNVTAEEFENELYTKDIPDPDLLIRTSNELRISNFLLWQMAYAELYFTDTLWPDFDEKELDRAIDAFSKRERRYGLISEQVKK